MTLAEIHGKISGSGSNVTDRLEDLLTSGLFGPLRYLPFETGLKPVLEGSINLQTGNHLDIGAVPVGDTFKVDFWPRLTHCEPDVLISTEDHILLVEAKYLSGKSGHYQDDQEFDDGESELVAAGSDQLFREYEDLFSLPGTQTNRSLIYLTVHRAPPAAQKNINIKILKTVEIPLPALTTQQAIVAEIEAEQTLVTANRDLIDRFENKIQITLARIWGEAALATPEA